MTATGRDAERCARLEDNLILEIYKQILREQRRPIVPLAIRMVNGIPLGMGCGSSAAARLAAIALAVHFGRLQWNTDADSRRGVRARRPSGQRGGVLAGRICRPRCAKGRRCTWRELIRRRSGERLLCFRRSRWPPARRARCCRRAIRLKMWWRTCSPWRCWGWHLRRRGAICCAWR